MQTLVEATKCQSSVRQKYCSSWWQELPSLQMLTKQCRVVLLPSLWGARDWDQQLNPCSLMAMKHAEPLMHHLVQGMLSTQCFVIKNSFLMSCNDFLDYYEFIWG